jgi:hypothetical protein
MRLNGLQNRPDVVAKRKLVRFEDFTAGRIMFFWILEPCR